MHARALRSRPVYTLGTRQEHISNTLEERSPALFKVGLQGLGLCQRRPMGFSSVSKQVYRVQFGIKEGVQGLVQCQRRPIGFSLVSNQGYRVQFSGCMVQCQSRRIGFSLVASQFSDAGDNTYRVQFSVKLGLLCLVQWLHSLVTQETTEQLLKADTKKAALRNRQKKKKTGKSLPSDMYHYKVSY